MSDKSRFSFGQVAGGVVIFFVVTAMFRGSGNETSLRLDLPQQGSTLSRAAETAVGTAEPVAALDIPPDTLTVEAFSEEPDAIGGLSISVEFRNTFDVPMLASTYATCDVFDAEGRRVARMRVDLDAPLNPGESAVVSEVDYLGSRKFRVSRVDCGFDRE